VLLCRYSNRPELTGPLVRAWKMINAGGDGMEDIPSVRSPTSRISRYVKDRYTERDIAAMAALYVSPGWTGEKVAAKYGINVRTVRRLMREHGVRKR
jgi:hypothetical protein